VRTTNHKADHFAVSSTLILLIRLRHKLLLQLLMIETLGRSPSHNVADQVSLPHKKGEIMALYRPTDDSSKAHNEIQFLHHSGHNLVSTIQTSRLILNKEIKVVYFEYASNERL
jgi:hypothetical protein